MIRDIGLDLDLIDYFLFSYDYIMMSGRNRRNSDRDIEGHSERRGHDHHGRGGRGGSHNREGRGGTHNREGRGGSHNREGRGGSHNREGRGGSHNREGRGGSHNREGRGGSHNREGRGGSHNREGRGGSHNREGRGGSHNREGRGGSHNEEGRGGNHDIGERSRSHDRRGRGGRRDFTDSVGQDHGQPLSNGATPSGTRPKYWTHDDIKNIANSSSENIVDYVQNEPASFINAFQYPRNLEKLFILKWLIKIMFGLCNSSDTAFAGQMLSKIFNECPSFIMKLQENLQISKLLYQDLHSLMKIGKFCIESIPRSVIFKFPQSELKEAVNELQANDSFKSLFKQYDEQFQEIKRQFKNQARDESGSAATNSHHEQITREITHDQPPPNNFHDIEILPHPDEIKDKSNKPFLRTNIVKGSYNDWGHYLDVHFRLLREDFMGPLRDGIHNFLQGIERSHDIQVYSGVRILSPVCVHTGVGFLIQFDAKQSHLTKVRWEHSRRLIYGSLLCLSQDNFRTVLFASVVGRNIDSLKSGQLVVKFEGDWGDVNVFSIDPTVEFQMVESTAYFEAYRHVLCRLQEINPDEMPFHSYIVGGCLPQTGIPLPLYLRRNPVLDLNSVLKLNRARPPIDVTKWPSLSNTCFDESQLKALHIALSQELSVIQGPPGTGKTYIGLKIVEALLQNRSAWNPGINCPILVVCYTNHALDQFLEGVLELDNLSGRNAPNVVRVGGRCKNEKVKVCAMSNLVSQMKAKQLVPSKVYRTIKENRILMKSMREKIEASLAAIDAKEGKILTIEELADIVNDRHYRQLTMGVVRVPNEKILEYWLELWFIPTPVPPPQTLTETDEDAELAAAMAESLKMSNSGQGLEEPNHEDGVKEEDDDMETLIDVLDEPQIMEEDRIIEGEEIEVPVLDKQPKVVKKEAEITQGEYGWQVKQLDSKTRKNRIKKGFENSPMSSNSADGVMDVWELNLKQRWRLYQHWLNGYIRHCKSNLRHSANLYDRCAQECQQADCDVNLQTLVNANVVGMTTTGAAKHSYILKHLNPKIVIVEEAAEVLESHIITSLCSSVQQLILIGDHKQLQPKITYYDLEKKYNLHISLFERLIANDVPVSTLAVQHRMRPEIASIVGNHIYEHLENHESVLNYENVKGIGKNLFFMDHYYPEENNPTGDKRSHANTFEADYVVELTRYLLKQGYDHSQITILTMYRGQLFAIRQRMKKDEFDGVRVAAVDDFQGEENDIIILSLVRSNSNGSIGFLKVENRVCVSLSRAKKGLFVIGDLSMLRAKENTKWPAILAELDGKGFVGNGLPLHCQNHPNEKLIARTPQDFSKCPEGGCQKMCGVRLECGHVCRSPCHPLDTQHKLIYKCMQKCPKVLLPCRHECSRKCFECTNNGGCSLCQINVSRILPACGHEVRMKCSQSADSFICRKRCEKLVRGCNHQCQNKCHEPCTPPEKCSKIVLKVLPCGHETGVPCSVSEDEFPCTSPCKMQLDCDHECNGTCGLCNRGRLHRACQKNCDRTLSCGHICRFPCTSTCPPCTQPCRNYCFHSKCPKMCYEPCAPCNEPCQWKCIHYHCTSKCGQPCNRPRCNAPCTKLLQCGHRCIGLCGEDCPTLCRVCDKEEVRTIFFGNEDDKYAQFVQLKDCSHVFEVTGLDYWMDQTVQTEESQVIKFIECPKCRTPIRRSLRYGNIIKKTIADMEAIKCMVLKQCNVDIHQLSHKANEMNDKAQRYHYLNVVSSNICKHIEKAKAVRQNKPAIPPLLPYEANTIENQLVLIPNIVKLLETLRSLPDTVCQFRSLQVSKVSLSHDTECLIKFLDTQYLTPQQINDAKCEIQRLSCLTRVHQIETTIVKDKKQLQRNDEQQLMEIATLLITCGQNAVKCTDEQHRSIQQFLNNITSIYSIGGISKEEKAMIIKAMGDIKPGGWYKCPKGHYYAIGDCGGANQVSKCPECGAGIGGTNHRLLEGNQHAGEMDNSRHSAWSEGANMMNYDFLRRMFN